MALFCFYCRDGENNERLREVHLEAQREWMAQHDENYRAAGPLTNKDGDFVGSLLIIEAGLFGSAAVSAFFLILRVNGTPFLKLLFRKIPSSQLLLDTR